MVSLGRAEDAFKPIELALHLDPLSNERFLWELIACRSRRHQCCQIYGSGDFGMSPLWAALRQAMRLTVRGTLRFVGVIVDQNVRRRTANTPAFTIRRDARREARGDRSAHYRASRYGPFACLL